MSAPRQKPVMLDCNGLRSASGVSDSHEQDEGAQQDSDKDDDAG